jgi:hypothetical protein
MAEPIGGDHEDVGEGVDEAGISSKVTAAQWR